MKAFIFDPLWHGLLTPENKALLEQAGVEAFVTTEEKPLAATDALFEGTEPRILALNPDYVGWKLAGDDYKDIPNLKAIITASTSYGWIEGDIADKKGIRISNIRNFSTEAVADWAVLMMLNVARKIPLLVKAGFPLNFGSDFQTYQGVNLKRKRVGIVGLGNVGLAIARRCEGLGMEVMYWSQSSKQTPYQVCDLDTLFRTADVIFPAMAENEVTRTILTDTLLESMKPDAMFISIVHKYYNHELLLKQVEDGRLYGYGFEDEKAGRFESYAGNVWAAPAYGWCTEGSLRGGMDKFVQAIADAAKGHFPTQVNKAV